MYLTAAQHCCITLFGRLLDLIHVAEALDMLDGQQGYSFAMAQLPSHRRYLAAAQVHMLKDITASY